MDYEKTGIRQSARVRNLVLCGVFAALTAVSAQIAIPIQPIPINLATLTVFLAGGVLGARGGAVSQLVYVLLGVIGLPVFSSFRGGPGVLVGPAGGYIAGYILAAWLIGWMLEKKGRSVPWMVCSILAGMLACYALGTGWFMLSTRSSLGHALMLCVVPFLLGDAAKLVCAVLLIPAIRKAVK